MKCDHLKVFTVIGVVFKWQSVQNTPACYVCLACPLDTEWKSLTNTKKHVDVFGFWW